MSQRSAYAHKEARAYADAFVGPKRVLLLAFVGNLALVAGLLGVPYLRGKSRATTAWTHYDQFSRCFFGEPPRATVRKQDAARDVALYATRVLSSTASPRASCARELAAVAPANDFFLLPSLKRAESALREAVRVAQAELAALPAKPARGVALSVRPLRAVAQLRSMLEAHSQAADLLELPTPAASLVQHPHHVVPTPGRIPLYAGSDAVVSLWGDDDRLHALGLDRTGLSYVALTDHVDTASRLPRPKLLHDALVRDGRVFLVWGMSPARCMEPGSCLGKSTGVAEAALPLTRLPTPRWFAAHLLGRADRSLRVDRADAITLLADSKPQPEVCSFPRPDLASAPPSENMPPLLASASVPGSPSGETVLLRADAGARFLSVSSDLTTHHLTVQSDAPDKTRLASLARGKHAWTVTCERAGCDAYAFGTEALLVLGVHGDTSYTAQPVSVAVGVPIDPSDRSRDRVRVFASALGVVAVLLDTERRLLSVFCSTDSAGSACTMRTLASDIESYAALQTDAALLLAYAGNLDAPQVRTRILDLRGNPTSSEQVPAPCWSSRNGMCGAPTLARLDARVVLAARDGTDLAALESPDQGKTWLPLHGAAPILPRDMLAIAGQ